MNRKVDAVVIGAGPAGCASAIRLASAGWRVMLVEQHEFPRQKVCGECLTPAGLELLDALGVGDEVLHRSGPDLMRVAWMSRERTVCTDLPAGHEGRHRYGRALGRDVLDSLLVTRAASLGVTVMQPAKVQSVGGRTGCFDCAIQVKRADANSKYTLTVSAAIVIDAHGSWEGGPQGSGMSRRGKHGSDLFGFKASFRDARLPPGLLPVLAFDGGYGGMVVADGGRLTLAGCIRRDTLHAWRAQRRAASAGDALESYLRHSCAGLEEALDGAERIHPWLSVGPLRPGIRRGRDDGPFLVGNAAGEMHPLIGEGISMALQSAFLLTDQLTRHRTAAIDTNWRRVSFAYHRAWRGAFAGKSRLAAACAHLAMHPVSANGSAALLQRFPQLLTLAARLAGKSRVPAVARRASFAACDRALHDNT
jgi:2-polyprenyl-6-methoxyphenol hydroxylase-like FAD-dependent oxidoreductase